MNLVIVESPTKARTISKFLGNEYLVKYSMGHLLDLPKSKLGVNLEKDFEPEYEVLEDKSKLINDLKKEAKKADSILLATDPDREGEAIAQHIAELLKLDKEVRSSILEKNKTKLPTSNNQDLISGFKRPISRIVFHEITQDAISNALKNPRSIDTHLVSAQTARRVLDRLVGYQISPVLWRKVRRGLSAGRVQSIALRLIVERERAIEQFKKEPYFTIAVRLSKQQIQPIEFELIEINGKKIEIKQTLQLYDGEYTYAKTIIDTKEKGDAILKALKGGEFVVSSVQQKETRRSPQMPFTTSTLQQEASRRFGFSGKRTMSIAQKLYEEGFITYHRTDSVVLSSTAISLIRSYLQANFGQDYLPKTPRSYQTKQKLAQEAHEAIRPTNVDQISNIKSQISDKVGNDGWKLYELIWNRAVASQMSDALIESTTVLAESNNNDTYRLKANGSVLLFDGFLRLTPQALEDTRLPKFVAGETLSFVSAQSYPHETTPVPRYNDASLIKALEEKGIGRPSTYASIVATLTDRHYVERVERRFEPTPIGIAVNDFLVKNFSTIDDVPFTAQMEDGLDAVAEGKKNWQEMIGDFYKVFAQQLSAVDKAERVKIQIEETQEKCPECGENLVIRHGRFGRFLSCSAFPKCRFTKPLVEETDLLCPKDQGKIIVRKTRKGRKFFGCANYPACDFAAWKLEDIKGSRPAKRGPASQEKVAKVKRGQSVRATKKRNLVKNVVKKRRSSK